MRTENKDKELNHRHFIGLRLTDVELDLLDQGAACLSISRSEYLRKETTFGVHVSGDSMEPRYHNEELIWIEQTEMLEDGEIGIFYLDGNAYVKKFQNNRKGTFLISLNKKYDPIPVTENSSFKIFGRVLS